MPVLSNEECRKTNYSSKMISDNMLCAGYPETGKKDSCQVSNFFNYNDRFLQFFLIQGDSGGPLIAQKDDKRYELIGKF